MNAQDKKARAEAGRFNPFWPCLLVFALLACEHGIGLLSLQEQHAQLQQTRAMQDQNLSALQQAQQMSDALQSLSLDLLAVAQTNAAAKQIVQDFNIRWNPGTSPAAPAGTAAPPPAATAAPERK